MMRLFTGLLYLGVLLAALIARPGLAAPRATNEILFADFDGDHYGAWKVTGTAFGSAPARGTLPKQQTVTGFSGPGLANSYLGGDAAIGTLVSPEFTIKLPYVNFLLGGGNRPGEACMNLVVDGQVVKSATGSEFERLRWHSWQLFPWMGKTARFEIIDRATNGWGHISIDQIVLSSRPRVWTGGNDAVDSAMVSVIEAERRAAEDRLRPVFHFLAPAHWMNDPNGPFFHKGYYHIYYQHNPFGDEWGHMHWGHARSRDLVTWKHLPVALWPSKERGEDHVFSGCLTTNASGGLMAFYTSIGQGRPASDYAEQWVAVGDTEGNTFEKHPGNPILSEQLHGSTKVYDWRDPFVFREGGKTYLVCGGNLNQAKGGQGVVLLYEAANGGLTEWKYRGVLFTHPDAAVKNVECPNFFKLGDRWVLILSPYGLVEYFVGDFNPGAGTFTAQSRGLVDAGRNYYAPNSMEDPKGRRVMWGWVNGFPKGRGWNGCLTLPRLLSWSEGRLQQKPAPELEALRGTVHRLSRTLLKNATNQLENIGGDALEIHVAFDRGSAQRFGLRVRGSDDARRAAVVTLDAKGIDVAGARMDWTPAEAKAGVDLRLYVDRTVLEAYVNGRCVTQVIAPEPGDVGLSLFADGGEATVRTLEVWPLRSIW